MERFIFSPMAPMVAAGPPSMVTAA